MFGKSDLIDILSRDLARARDKREALVSDVTALTAEIAVLESRLCAENIRRERERAVSEIEGIKKRVNDQYLAFAPAIAGIRDATEIAAAIIPEARELNGLLTEIATEVGSAIDGLLGDLNQRIEAARAALPEMSQSLDGSSDLSQDNDRSLRSPEWLPLKNTETEELEDRCSTAAA
jgi:hypothetical protein